jgi:hypothetical protein
VAWRFANIRPICGFLKSFVQKQNEPKTMNEKAILAFLYKTQPTEQGMGTHPYE